MIATTVWLLISVGTFRGKHGHEVLERFATQQQCEEVAKVLALPIKEQDSPAILKTTPVVCVKATVLVDSKK